MAFTYTNVKDADDDAVAAGDGGGDGGGGMIITIDERRFASRCSKVIRCIAYHQVGAVREEQFY